MKLTFALLFLVIPLINCNLPALDDLWCHKCNSVLSRGATDSCLMGKPLEEIPKIKCGPAPSGNKPTCLVVATTPQHVQEETVPRHFERTCSSIRYGLNETTTHMCRRRGDRIACHCDTNNCNTYDLLKEDVWKKIIAAHARRKKHQPTSSSTDPQSPLQQQIFNLHQQSLNLHQQSLNLHQQSLNLHQQSLNLQQQLINNKSLTFTSPAATMPQPGLTKAPKTTRFE